MPLRERPVGDICPDRKTRGNRTHGADRNLAATVLVIRERPGLSGFDRRQKLGMLPPRVEADDVGGFGGVAVKACMGADILGVDMRKPIDDGAEVQVDSRPSDHMDGCTAMRAASSFLISSSA
jgi:hypothetical protein